MRDYSGGWKSKVADYKRFSNNCKPYTGPRDRARRRGLRRARRLALGPPAVGPPVEQLRRRLGAGRALHLALARRHRRPDHPDRLGLPRQAPAPLGQLTFHHKPVFGLKHTLQGVPTDKPGRNVYVDFLTGPTWRRVNSFLTHPPTAGFCYTFANHPGGSPAWDGQGTATHIAPRRSARASRRSCRRTSRRRSRTTDRPTKPRSRAAGTARARCPLPHRLGAPRAASGTPPAAPAGTASS